MECRLWHFSCIGDWWLSTFTADERDYIELRYGGDTEERPLTQGQLSTSQTAPQLLCTLSSWFQSSQDRHLACRILEMSEELSVGCVLDLHFTYSEMIPIYYRDRDGDSAAVDAAIATCEKQVALAPEAAQAFKVEYPTDSELPGHRGFNQLAIIREKERNYPEVIRLASEAMAQGWAGNWENRIARCEKRLAKS